MAKSSDLSDLKHFLRRYDFPNSTRQALIQLEKLSHYQYTPQHQKLTAEVIDEFVFGEIDNRGIHRLRFSAVQEFQLLEVLCSYFETQKDENVRTNVFLTLFPIHDTTNHRTKLLAQLLSLGIAANNVPILKCGAMWMMSQSRSKTVMEVAKLLVTDYFCLVPESASLLKDLPDIAPLFTANFMTAVTSLYSMTGRDFPPPMLLRQITTWISNYPRLCLTPRLIRILSVQNSPFVVTPVSGLLSWTVLSPILNDIDSKAHVQQQISEPYSDEQTELSLKNLETYSQLHLALLESMLEMKNEQKIPTYTALISSDEIISIIKRLKQNAELNGSEIADESLDRLGQALQISLSQRELHGNISEIMSWINQLPPNRLLSILQAVHTPTLFAKDRR